VHQEKMTGVRTSRPVLDALRPSDNVTVTRFNSRSAHLVMLLKQFKEMKVYFVALDLGDSASLAG
jgi:hypothetical protein